MSEDAREKPRQDPQPLPSANRHKEFWASGRLVFARDKQEKAFEPPPPASSAPSPWRARILDGDGKLMGFPVIRDPHVLAKRTDLEQPPEVLSLDQLARRAIEGLDYAAVMDPLRNLGPDGRVALFYRQGKLVRYEVFEDPRICKDIERGAVIHNLEQQPSDMSGWRVHDFTIDSKGCLGEVCTRCLRVCPENAIHLRGEGGGSFCAIDPTACKGCFICWVECSRKAADCILIDGKVFDSELRAAHFGE